MRKKSRDNKDISKNLVIILLVLAILIYVFNTIIIINSMNKVMTRDISTPTTDEEVKTETESGAPIEPLIETIATTGGVSINILPQSEN